MTKNIAKNNQQLSGVSNSMFNDTVNSLYYAFNEFGKIDEWIVNQGVVVDETDPKTSLSFLSDYLGKAISRIKAEYNVEPFKVVKALSKLTGDVWFNADSGPKLTKVQITLLTSLESTLEKTIKSLWDFWDCVSSDASMGFLPVEPKEMAMYLEGERQRVFDAIELTKNPAPSKFFHRQQFVHDVCNLCWRTDNKEKIPKTKVADDILSLIEPFCLYSSDTVDSLERINSDIKEYKKHKSKNSSE